MVVDHQMTSSRATLTFKWIPAAKVQATNVELTTVHAVCGRLKMNENAEEIQVIEGTVTADQPSTSNVVGGSKKGKKQLQRRGYNREFKLTVIKSFYNHGRNVAQTAKKFKVDRKQVRSWVSSEEKIRKQPYKSKAPGRGTTAKFPLMEHRLYSEFTELRKEGRKVKRWWFNTRAEQLVNELYPEVKDFKHSDQWFARFCTRKKISLRKTTHAAQHAPSDLNAAISRFHAKLLRVRRRGSFSLGDIANMDQTPLPFVLDDGKTYEGTGKKEVWTASAASGLDKRQCTVQLTVFADGKPRVRPTIIFRGQGKRIAKSEQESWDSRVRVMFQKKAWCDEVIMKEWVASEWANVFTNPHTASSTGKILVADVHTAQQTDDVKAALCKYKTELVNVPPGCTSRIQPLDVSVNKPFKEAVKRQHEAHISENLALYTEGRLTASDRRVLLTKWVGVAWQEINQKKDVIVRSFRKCGISLAVDGTENSEVKIEGIPDYKMPAAEGEAVEFRLESDTSDIESDDFETVADS